MIVNLHGAGIELTDAIRAYAEEKFSALVKFAPGIKQLNIDIGARTNHHRKGKIFYAEVNVLLGGSMVRVAKDAEDLYRAIDKVKNHLKVELEKAKYKFGRKDKAVLRNRKEYHPL